MDSQLVLRAGKFEGRWWVVATRADTNSVPLKPPEEEPLPIAGPMDYVSDFVHRPR